MFPDATCYKVSNGSFMSISYCNDSPQHPSHDEVIKDFNQKFLFVLFDLKNETIFVAKDRDSDMNFAWGKVWDASLAFSDDFQIIRDMCGRSSTFFPAGCFYMNSTGLVSFEQPLHKVKAIRCSVEDLCAPSIIFVVDRWCRRPGIPRVGSESNWSDACNTRKDDHEGATWI
ncbi:uncharacterized protein [Elaeis guineensis]|uniref:uncharacterized protein n=1 Tax=Elaeis guineensis var. tenera TaxID=51953 RepID=UPI003C6D1073